MVSGLNRNQLYLDISKDLKSASQSLDTVDLTNLRERLSGYGADLQKSRDGKFFLLKFVYLIHDYFTNRSIKASLEIIKTRIDKLAKQVLSPEAPPAPPAPSSPSLKVKKQVEFKEESPVVIEYEMDPGVQKGKKKGGLTTKHGAIGQSAEEIVNKRMERFKVQSPSFENFALKFINLNNSFLLSDKITAAPDTAQYLGRVMERVVTVRKGEEPSVLMQAVLEAVINENNYVKSINFNNYINSINQVVARFGNMSYIKVPHAEKVRLGEDEDPINSYGDWFDNRDEIREVHCMHFLVDEDEGIDELKSLRSVLEHLFKDDEFLNWMKT